MSKFFWYTATISCKISHSKLKLIIVLVFTHIDLWSTKSYVSTNIVTQYICNVRKTVPVSDYGNGCVHIGIV